MKKYLYPLVLFCLVSFVAVACVGQNKPRPIPASMVGRVGGLPLSWFGTAALQPTLQLVAQNRSAEAEPALQKYARKSMRDSDTKVAYIALIQISPAFRNAEANRLADLPDTNDAEQNFKKAAALIYSYEESLPTHVTGKYLDGRIARRVEGFHLAKQVWDGQKDKGSTALLMEAYTRQSLSEAIRYYAGEDAWNRYKAAGATKWQAATPPVSLTDTDQLPVLYQLLTKKRSLLLTRSFIVVNGKMEPVTPPPSPEKKAEAAYLQGWRDAIKAVLPPVYASLR